MSVPRIAHMINLFRPAPSSDLVLAQEVTVRSMVRAKQEAQNLADIELLACCSEQDIDLIPDGFTTTKTLDRNVTDLQAFEREMALPILKDILDRLYNESDAEYLIFTNVDIALQPQFYKDVIRFIQSGHDAFMINRRRIPAKFTHADELPKMYLEQGRKHPGFDCFVFKRELYPKFSLAQVCVGVPFIEMTLSQNLFCFAKNPKVFTDEHLTFHIGMEIFKKRAPKEYLDYNRAQFWQAMERIWPMLDSSKWTFGTIFFPIRMVYWGLHPCFPIMLALNLEPRRWGIK